MRLRVGSAAVLFGLAALAGTTVASAGPTTMAANSIVPGDFTSNVDNPWFPLPAGTTMTYVGTKEGKAAVEHFRITTSTKVIDGVSCRVIKDNLFLDGKLAERTEDWYAQDDQGSVWYFGEATETLDDQGNVISTEGSWRSGVNGARPGIVMPARPRIGQSFQQEFAGVVAEDHFVVLNLVSSVTVPAGTFDHVLATAEWTPLEPDVLSTKHYVRGIGLVREADVAGGDEELALSAITSG